MTKEKLETLTKKELMTVYPNAGLKMSMLKGTMINKSLEFEKNKTRPKSKKLESIANEY